jgi:hypothetical protein
VTQLGHLTDSGFQRFKFGVHGCDYRGRSTQGQSRHPHRVQCAASGAKAAFRRLG